MKIKKEQNDIDPKDLMAVERATTALVGTAISLIILGFVVEKFELFLHILAVDLADKQHTQIPQLVHREFYNYLGFGIVSAGIILSLYTYRYYTRWIRHLENGTIDSDKSIYLWLALFIAGIGVVLLASMIVI